MDFLEKYNEWLAYDKLDDEIKLELMAIGEDEQEIRERFLSDLKFGTGGLRGILGAGTDRMNIYTVRRATQGLALYVKEQGGEERGVVIAYDSRFYSPEFARTAARVLAGNGIRVYLFTELRPTPELSFAVRHLGCEVGIVITASHNPAKYNGYKVYGPDGGQVANEAADYIFEKMQSTPIFGDIPESEMDSPLIRMINEEVDQPYYDAVLSQMIHKDLGNTASEMKIVYTPFHGAGAVPVKEVLRRGGFHKVYVVPEQEAPDGAFPTVKSPNPEDKEGFALAIELANKMEADLIIGTDPDSDRVGVLAREMDGSFVALTGNMTGVLLTEYILSQKTGLGLLPENPYVVKTVVTSEMIRCVTDHYGVELIDVLTGFKYIADTIHDHEEAGDMNFVFGFEESYGYLVGDYARDKDGVSACLLIAEMAAWYQSRGMTLCDVMRELYAKYGIHKEWTKNVYFEGTDGIEKIKSIMERLRSDIPETIGWSRVVAYTDYSVGVRHDVLSGSETKVNLPSSNVLRFELEDKSWVAFRPSGTEPKFKIYAGVTRGNLEAKIDAIAESVNALFAKE
ncbi:MAG: phospho-sugar mutase [Clostridia bacterium]|nr:phospho-sugar mutase [Clostridia bacterium]